MLIVLSCAEGVGKKQLAKAIINQLNSFEHDGYTIDYNHAFNGDLESIKINDKLFTDLGGVLDEDDEYKDILEYAKQEYQPLFLDKVTSWHTFNAHVDIDHHFGLTPIHKAFNETDMLHSVDVIDMYNKRPFDNLVVSGVFSKYYLDYIKANIGDDVVFYNITRNPSVSYLMDYKEEEFYNSGTKPDLNSAVNKQKFAETLLATAKLIEVDYVNTIKFEDIIANGLTIEGTNIDLWPGYEAYNDYITKYEKDNHKEQDLTEANNKLINFDPLWWDPEMDAFINEMKTLVPNVFDMYPDYEPLDYVDIVSPGS